MGGGYRLVRAVRPRLAVEAGFPGRFESQRASLSSDYIQPNFAYRFAPGWSIGGGPVFGVSHVELRQAIDLSAAPVPGGGGVTFGQLGIPAGTQFATADLKGDATAWGFNVGVHGKIGADWQVGARYLSELKFKYKDADVQFTQQLTNLVLAGGNPFGASRRHAARRTALGGVRGRGSR